MFIPYTAKPIVRMAVEITSACEYLDVNTYRYQGVTFKAYEQPVIGDYVVRLTEADTYHCSRAVFHERNIIP